MVASSRSSLLPKKLSRKSGAAERCNTRFGRWPVLLRYAPDLRLEIDDMPPNGRCRSGHRDGIMRTRSLCTVPMEGEIAGGVESGLELRPTVANCT